VSVVEIVDYLTDAALLRRRAVEVKQEEVYADKFCAFVVDLTDTLAASGGIGLAATQLRWDFPAGVPWRVFAVRDPKRGRPMVVVNPVIRSASDQQWRHDGCLSFRSVTWTCRYPEMVTATAVDDDWKPLDLVVTGLEARCFAHEEEHLRGRVMLDRMRADERSRFLAKVAKASHAVR
jgi:peptide deformylase